MEIGTYIQQSQIRNSNNWNAIAQITQSNNISKQANTLGKHTQIATTNKQTRKQASKQANKQ